METTKQRRALGVLTQSAWFMAALTFLGGYIDAYTYVVRGGVFANNQTANIAKMGITLFAGDWPGTLNAFLPMAATILGAFFAEHVKQRRSHNPRLWQQQLLWVEMAALAVVGFIPVTIPHVAVNLPLSFIAAMQLSAFRSFEGWIHNTTICTGNMRSLGQYYYQALFVEKNPEFRRKTGRYTLVFLSFLLGAFMGAVASRYLGAWAIWPSMAVLLAVIAAHRTAPESVAS